VRVGEHLEDAEQERMNLPGVINPN